MRVALLCIALICEAFTSSVPASIFGLPPTTTLSAAGEALIREQEGYDYHPELPDLRFSGITWGFGYDAHQNSVSNILSDWSKLPASDAAKLADTQPYYGRSAVTPLQGVRHIRIPFDIGVEVFDRIDVSREFANARRHLPGFDELRPNAQAALVSIGFNRGWSFSGDNRREMRTIRDLVPKKDYDGMATQIRIMKRVWTGTSIQHDMYSRREAEARLMQTP